MWTFRPGYIAGLLIYAIAMSYLFGCLLSVICRCSKSFYFFIFYFIDLMKLIRCFVGV